MHTCTNGNLWGHKAEEFIPAHHSIFLFFEGPQKQKDHRWLMKMYLKRVSIRIFLGCVVLGVGVCDGWVPSSDEDRHERIPELITRKNQSTAWKFLNPAQAFFQSPEFFFSGMGTLIALGKKLIEVFSWNMFVLS